MCIPCYVLRNSFPFHAWKFSMTRWRKHVRLKNRWVPESVRPFFSPFLPFLLLWLKGHEWHSKAFEIALPWYLRICIWKGRGVVEHPGIKITFRSCTFSLVFVQATTTSFITFFMAVAQESLYAQCGQKRVVNQVTRCCSSDVTQARSRGPGKNYRVDPNHPPNCHMQGGAPRLCATLTSALFCSSNSALMYRCYQGIEAEQLAWCIADVRMFCHVLKST